MLDIQKDKPVMITGASGYVAGWIVNKLLAAGLTVHAPVRNPDNPGKIKHLNDLAAALPGEIKYFKADLLDQGSYAEAMAGCGVVFHTASPFTINVKDPQKELVDPAQLGTRNVLEQATKTPSVERIVLTSSCAAIYGDNADMKKTPDGMFTEEIWNTSSSLDHGAYSYSKTVAEKEAWHIHDKQNQWDLVVINPTLVIGPGTNPHATSESFNIIKQFGDGSMKPGAPRVGFGVVDVRDLADAHFAAAFTPSAKGRHIISGHDTDFVEMASTLLEDFGDKYPIPRKAMPKWLVWLVAPMVDKTITRKWVAKNVNLPWKGDNRKGKQELGVSYRPMKESMVEFFQQAIESGLVPPPK